MRTTQKSRKDRETSTFDRFLELCDHERTNSCPQQIRGKKGCLQLNDGCSAIVVVDPMICCM